MYRLLILTVFIVILTYSSSFGKENQGACSEISILEGTEQSSVQVLIITQDKPWLKKFFKIGKKKNTNPCYATQNIQGRTKVSAIIVLLLTGPLGGHRLYLGTHPAVPVFYAVSLGGGLGILPIIDLFCIIFTKDLNRYVDNKKILMFIGE